MLFAGYYVNDMVRQTIQGSTNLIYTLDPARRILARTGTPSLTNHYADDTDNPAWTETALGGAQYTRNITGVDGNLAAIYDSTTGKASMQLTNLHGDVTDTADASPTATSVTATYDADEFGTPQTATPRYGWLGAKERSVEYPSGTMLMGRRLYQPQLGRWSSPGFVDI
jgi:hypothetical protein